MNKKNVFGAFLGLVFIGAITVGVMQYGTILNGVNRFISVVQGAEVKPLLSSESRYIRQIVGKDNATSRTIMWQSDSSEQSAMVEYRLVGSDALLSAPATNVSFTDDGSTTYIHEATLVDLTPDTKYEYRVGYDSDRRSDWKPLQTASEKGSYEVLIYPDSQSADYSGWEQIVKDSAARHPNAVMYLSMGDLVDNGEQVSQWRTWLSSVEPLSSRIPLAPMMGNHEMYALNWKMREPKAYLAYFDVPDNGSENFDRRYYSYDYGDVHYVVLDTQFFEANHADNSDTHHPDLYDVQIQWLRNDLSKNTKKWTVVLMHRDPFQYAINGRTNRESGFSEEGTIFMPIFDEYNVDLVLSAHLHTYRDRGHIRNFERDATGPLYIITGIAGDVRYPNLWQQHPLDVYVAPQPETNNYMTLDVSLNQLIVKSYLPDGTVLEEVSIDK